MADVVVDVDRADAPILVDEGSTSVGPRARGIHDQRALALEGLLLIGLPTQYRGLLRIAGGDGLPIRVHDDDRRAAEATFEAGATVYGVKDLPVVIPQDMRDQRGGEAVQIDRRHRGQVAFLRFAQAGKNRVRHDAADDEHEGRHEEGSLESKRPLPRIE